jgi:hypothetical protein
MSPLYGIAALTCIPAFLFVRLHIVYGIQRKACWKTHEMHLQEIDSGTWNEAKWDEDWNRIDDRYHALILDLRKWTFRQFYPELA